LKVFLLEAFLKVIAHFSDEENRNSSAVSNWIAWGEEENSAFANWVAMVVY
jgi:7,8-dihydro-6-hydroxymethylpterin-pyrophosphokinase